MTQTTTSVPDQTDTSAVVTRARGGRGMATAAALVATSSVKSSQRANE